jgi:hypothetical protein
MSSWLKWLTACFVAAPFVAPAQPAETFSADHISSITRMVASLPVYGTFAGGMREGLEDLRKGDPERAALAEALFVGGGAQDFAKRMAPAYARHISLPQAEEITAFAQSETGRKYFAAEFGVGKAKATAQYSAEERDVVDRFRKSPAAAALDRVYGDPDWDRALTNAGRSLVEAAFNRLMPIAADLRERGAKIQAVHVREALALQSDKFEIPEVLRSPESIRAGRANAAQLEVLQAKHRRELWAYHEEWLAEMRRHVEAGEVPEAIIPFNQAKIHGIEERLDRQFEHERLRFALYRELLAFAESRLGKYAIDDADGQVAFEDDADLEAFSAIAARWNREIDRAPQLPGDSQTPASQRGTP